MTKAQHPAPARREYRGVMKPNRTYAERVAYWWVFTYPGSRAAAVLEVREAKSAGAAYKTRRYAVTEANPEPGGRRFFGFYKPFRERRPTDTTDRYSVLFDHKNLGRCSCTCPGFKNRGVCSHLESLVCLMGPRGPANEVTGGMKADPRRATRYEKTHPKTAARAAAAGNVITLCDWTAVPGKKYVKCARCGRPSWDPDRMDASPAAPCDATRVLQPAPGKPVVKRTVSGGSGAGRKAPPTGRDGKRKPTPPQTRETGSPSPRKGGGRVGAKPPTKGAGRGR